MKKVLLARPERSGEGVVCSKTADQSTTLIRLSQLGGLSNAENLLVCQMLAKVSLTDGDVNCLRAMRDRHLS